MVYGPQGLWAIEVKHGATIHPSDLRGLRSFLDDYPEARAILAHRGRERLARDGVLCIPVEELLLGLRPGSGIGD